MQKIKKLPPLEAQKIAAGEVVERPVNAVKELIENSIDAQAESIAIYLEDAGKKSIRIIDNGCGMSSADAQLCFSHHATSKISSVTDLDTLTSFGFRGEALASITAISRVTLITAQPIQSAASKIEIKGGIQQSFTETSHSPGTEFIIEDIFYNVPARKKFLKTTPTELRAITNLFSAFCFDYLSINFSLYSEKKLLYQCRKTDDLKQRIAQLWPANEVECMIKLNPCKEKSFSIDGMISNHQHARYDKSHIFMYVNHRLVKNQHLIKAVLKGYGGILPATKYPAAIIHITIAQDQIDVNVHPRKQEIQFLHPRLVEQTLQNTISQTLASYTSTTIAQTRFNPIAKNSSAAQFPFTAHHVLHKPTALIKTESKPSAIIFPQKSPVSGEQITLPSTSTTENQLFYNILGQLLKTYILAEGCQGLVLVDQHAAHERILYEECKSKFGSIAATNLLFPELLTLTMQETDIIAQHLDLLRNYGIILEQLGRTLFTVQATPVFLKQCSITEIIRDIIRILLDQQPQEHIGKTINEHVHAQMACKAAVKAGDELSTEKMSGLLHDLEVVSNRQTCPHGRPTWWHISSHEIERKFKRRL